MDLLLAVVCIAASSVVVHSMPEDLVRIDDGILRGSMFTDINGEAFYAFQSIPYARPPIGKLRFKSPKPARKWKGILDATKEMKICVQGDSKKMVGEEDCLYLNVYTRNHRTANRMRVALKPVMVYIHGGGFVEGSGIMSELGPEYLMSEDVIVVTINYRVGALGFLSLEGSDVSANNGLKDQVLALKWVKRNIARFGGDPDSVTIFGESAGAVSVDLLMLSPLAKGLFHKCIAQSGSALEDWMVGANNSALPIAEYLGIDAKDPKALVEELRRVPCEKIFEAQLNTNWGMQIHEPWPGGVIVEGPGPDSFLPEDPKAMIQAGNFHKVPLLMGFTNKEGILLEIFSPQPFSNHRPRDVPYGASRGVDDRISAIIDGLNEEYFPSGVPSEITEEVVSMWSDIWFKRAVVTSAKLHAAHHKVFLYEFSADTSLNFFKLLFSDTISRPGASHVDDLGYLFKRDSSPALVEGGLEDSLVRETVKLWTNFARCGEPLLEYEIVQWKTVTEDDANFLNITNAGLQSGIYDTKRVDFLNDLFNY